MYRFLLFSYAEYYPCGGLDDDRVGMRINDMPYVATSDNKNVKAIMQKLLK